MKQLAVLVLDGGLLRTSAPAVELQGQGWDLRWVDSASLTRDLAGAGRPDLVLFDPAGLGAQGPAALQALRSWWPGLPMAGLGRPGQGPGWSGAGDLEPSLQCLDRAQPGAWPGRLRSFLEPAARSMAKFSAEDLFGDIVSDLEAPAEPGSPGGSPWAQADPEVPDAGVPLPPAPGVPEDEYVLEEFGNYNLLEKVAVGGMAELFKARQRGVHDFQKIVAIKRILPHLSDNEEFVRMFIDEAKLAAQLNHPNIVQLFDLGKAGGFYYIAMEFVDGRDLRNLLRKVREYKTPMPEVLAAMVAMRVASALDYAHRKRGLDGRELKLVHRDISPQNLLISYEGAVKLVDFGIAKAATKNTQTQAGALKGKLLYMSPEQAMGQPLDGRSDIYSLGLVLAELLTGERCFQADSELGVLEKARLGKVVDIRALNPGVSQEMGRILDLILQKEVGQRYASARLLERDLKALLARERHEPTEQDLADYVNTLLKGTPEELASLLASRYPSRAEARPAPAGGDDRPPGAVPEEAVPPAAPAGPRRPWRWPALGTLAALAAYLIWAVLR